MLTPGVHSTAGAGRALAALVRAALALCAAMACFPLAAAQDTSAPATGGSTGASPSPSPAASSTSSDNSHLTVLFIVPLIGIMMGFAVFSLLRFMPLLSWVCFRPTVTYDQSVQVAYVADAEQATCSRGSGGGRPVPRMWTDHDGTGRIAAAVEGAEQPALALGGVEPGGRGRKHARRSLLGVFRKPTAEEDKAPHDDTERAMPSQVTPAAYPPAAYPPAAYPPAQVAPPSLVAPPRAARVAESNRLSTADFVVDVPTRRGRISTAPVWADGESAATITVGRPPSYAL
ncbi:hypothetical protein HK105_205546 [Polyrhizophydium stewartii]|uniref:Uncharacterized protein n=1 Tax=Polyrhizophydium stewartii TaxID=2732419 RepID=A0ABR4N655_9FUNG|nr:hypothetical protein HK105_001640 [Polyrhizophydium stewartii]